eukprot:1976504-Rhodomonas_salina.2
MLAHWHCSGLDATSLHCTYTPAVDRTCQGTTSVNSGLRVAEATIGGCYHALARQRPDLDLLLEGAHCTSGIGHGKGLRGVRIP